MNWKIKAAVQRACIRIPVGRQAIYRQIQCRFGKLIRGYDYSFLLRETMQLATLLRAKGYEIEGTSVMEVGTGWRLDIPLALYLLGARRIITCDLHRYLVESLTLNTVRYVLANQNQICDIFSSVDPSSLKARVAALRSVSSLKELMATTGIEYHAPCDCSRTGFPAHSIDLHFSYTVFEHIPGPTLENILLEANRLLSDHGVALHHIDLSDHFEQVDPSITKVNFLQFSDEEWRRYSGTPWSYHNRLRENEFRELFQKANQDVLYWSTKGDQRSLSCLKNGFPLAAQYQGKPAESLSTVIVDVISLPSNRQQVGAGC